eukprot:gene14925-20978_t
MPLVPPMGLQWQAAFKYVMLDAVRLPRAAGTCPESDTGLHRFNRPSIVQPLYIFPRIEVDCPRNSFYRLNRQSSRCSSSQQHWRKPTASDWSTMSNQTTAPGAAVDSLPQNMKDLSIKEETGSRPAPPNVEREVFEGRLVEGDLSAKGGNHILSAVSGSGADRQTFNYSTDRIVGNGSFGVVFQATCLETGETVAIKKVLQDKRFKNRELQIMKMVDHPNIVSLKHCFYSQTEEDETYLHLVLEFVPDTVYRLSKHYAKNNQRMPNIFVKLYAYQMCRSLGAIHRLGICHRDIKPQNLLVNPESHCLKLCDFGSAKLIFGATDYSAAIDVWSVGCVLAELLLGQPLFPGESGVDQLVEIIKVLGTPTREEIHAMNPNYTEFKFPQIKAHPWSKVFSKRMPPDAVDLRVTPFQAMTHPFFDEIRDPNTTLPNGRPLPPLFNWLPGELDNVPADIVRKLQPKAA